jgi:hypothetical protein
MSRSSHAKIALLVGVSVCALAGFSELAASQMPDLPALPAHPSTAVTPGGLLAKRFDASTPNAEQLNRGLYLVAAGDCMSCHLREGG